MECILTGREMAEFDNYTIEHIGIPSLVLMENASRAMADVIYKNHKDKRILVIAGTGNNGADGLCICRILRTRGVDCRKKRRSSFRHRKKFWTGWDIHKSPQNSFGITPGRRSWWMRCSGSD